MSIQLQPDQMVAVLQRLDHPLFPSFLDQLLSLSDAMAEVIVEAIPDITHTGPADLWGDAIMVGFNGFGPIPEALQGFDDEGWPDDTHVT